MSRKTSSPRPKARPKSRSRRKLSAPTEKPVVVLSHREILELLPRETLDRLGRESVVQVARDAEALRRRASRADGIVTLLTRKIDRALLSRASRLRVIGNVAVGVDNIDLHACRAAQVKVVNTPGVLTRATAELALALLLATARRVPEGDRMCREGRFTIWELDMLLGKELRGRNAVIAGAGRIGKETARLFRGIGLKTEFIRREDTEASVRAKLSRAQVLSIHLPLTPATRHWLNAARIARLPADSIVINTARGPVIDEAALVRALRSRKIFGAGLDVYEREPIIPASLKKLPNVVLLPHIGSATEATRRRMAQTAVEGVLEVLAGRRPKNLLPMKKLD